MNPARIVVGVDSRAPAGAASNWAAAEAQARGAELLLLHALETDLGCTDRGVAQLLQDLRERLLGQWPRLVIRTQLSHAPPAEAVIDASFDAALLVVGDNGFADIANSMMATVGRRIGARAHCPVVIVPGSTPAQPAGSTVVVGLAPTTSGRRALAMALEHAHLHGLAVRGVRAGPEDPALTSLGGLVAQHDSNLVFSIERSDATAVTALLATLGDAALLVLGCHHSSDPWSARLGDVPAELIGTLPCPLLLVGQLHSLTSVALQNDFDPLLLSP